MIKQFPISSGKIYHILDGPIIYIEDEGMSSKWKIGQSTKYRTFTEHTKVPNNDEILAQIYKEHPERFNY